MLKITLGPMYAGKTSALMKEYTECPGRKVIIDFNIGIGEKCFRSVIKNHDEKQLECVKSKQLYLSLIHI